MTQDKLTFFGFTKEWYDKKIIDQNYLDQLYQEYCESEDKNKEHYRAWAFHVYLSNKKSLNEDEIETIVRLEDCGDDLCDLSDQRIHELLFSEILSLNQLEKLKIIFPAILQRPFQKLYNRKLNIKHVNINGLSRERFDIILKSNDSESQRYLLDNCKLSDNQLEALIEYGGNKKVRNIASTLYKKAKRKKHLTNQ